MSAMIKVGPPFHATGTRWDNKGKTEIAQIVISSSKTRINFMYFVYAEDGGNKLVLSEKFGVDATSNSIETVTFDYPFEHITRVSGQYDEYAFDGKFLCSITFYTNKGTHGPYVPGEPSKRGKAINFNYQVGGKFCGFFGSYRSDCIESIGFYFEPQVKPAKPPGKLISIGSGKAL